MGPFAYIACSGEDSVYVIDLGASPNPQVLASVFVGFGSRGVAVSPDKKTVYVTVEPSSSVQVIDTNKNNVVRTISVGANPYGVAVTPDGKQVYVANNGDDTVSMIDTTTYSVLTVQNLPTGVARGVPSSFSGPFGVACGMSGKVGLRVYVTNRKNSTLALVDPAHPEWGPQLPVIPPDYKAPSSLFYYPQGVAVTPDGYIYVTNGGAVIGPFPGLTVTHEGLITPINYLQTKGEPMGVAISPDGKSAYVANKVGVAVIDTTTKTVTNLSNPDFKDTLGVSVTPDGKYLCVTNSSGDSVTVVTLPGLSPADFSNVPVGKSPNSFGQFI